MKVTPLDAAVIAAAAVAFAAFARWRAAGFRMPRRRVEYDDPARQIEADFPPEHRAEAAALLESIAVHAHPEHQAMVRRVVLRGVRGRIEKLRRTASTSPESMARIYRFFGEPPAAPQG